MKPAPLEYVAPDTIEEACEHLAAAGGGATVLAGGQTLLPLLALRMSQPFVLVDINRIRALTGVQQAADGVTRIGPMTRQSALIEDATVARKLPLVATATRHIGHHPIRNRGTIGGSIALGEPAAELPATAVALGATVELRSLRGTRRVAADELYLGPYSTAIESDELLTAVEFPEWPADSVMLFRELAPRPGDFALIGLCGALSMREGRVARAGLAWFGMGPTPIKARLAEAALVGRTLAELDTRELAELGIRDTAPFDDHHASAEYRRTVGRRLFARTLNEALGAQPREQDAPKRASVTA